MSRDRPPLTSEALPGGGGGRRGQWEGQRERRGSATYICPSPAYLSSVATAPGNWEGSRQEAGGRLCAQVSGPCTPGFSPGRGRAQVEMPECSLTFAPKTGAAEGTIGRTSPAGRTSVTLSQCSCPGSDFLGFAWPRVRNHGQATDLTRGLERGRLDPQHGQRSRGGPAWLSLPGDRPAEGPEAAGTWAQGASSGEGRGGGSGPGRQSRCERLGGRGGGGCGTQLLFRAENPGSSERGSHGREAPLPPVPSC